MSEHTRSGWPQTWKPGILRDFSERGKLREFSEFCEFCATSGKNCNKVFLVHHSNILCKTAVDWVNRIIMNLDESHYYIYFLLR